MAEPNNKDVPVDKSLVSQICTQVKYDMMRDSIKPHNSFYLSVNTKFLEKMQHVYYSSWGLDKRKRVLYVDVEILEEDRNEVTSVMCNFIAKLANMMNSIVVVNCVSNQGMLLLYKCLQNLLVSKPSLYDLIKILVPSTAEKNSVLKKVEKNQYDALLTSSEGEVEQLVGYLCQMISLNDTRDSTLYRLLWISRENIPNELNHWKLCNQLFFEIQQTEIILVSAEGVKKILDKNNCIDEVLKLVIKDVPLKEFVHSDSLRIVQYLMRERIIPNETDEEGGVSISGINPNDSIKQHYDTLWEYKQSPHKQSQNKYVVNEITPAPITETTFDETYLRIQLSESVTTNFSVECPISSELGEALSTALHGGNTHILGCMLKYLCTYLDKVSYNSEIIQFFNFEYLSKQYKESYERNENYFRTLMRKLGIKQNGKFSFTILDGVLDKLMYQLDTKIHHQLSSDSRGCKHYFQLYLFIWGILTQNLDIAEQTLRWYPDTNEQIATALAGTRLLERIIQLFKNDHEISSESIQDLEEKKVHFESLALNLLKEDEFAQDDNTKEQLINKDVGATMRINELTTLRNTPAPKNKYRVNSHNKDNRLESRSVFWESSIIVMAHEGECRLFIASEEVQRYVHQKSLDYHVRAKLLIDLVLFRLLFYLFHCLVSLKLVPESYNSSPTAVRVYQGLLGLYGVWVIVFMLDSILRTIIQKSKYYRSFNGCKSAKLFTPLSSDGYIMLVFYVSFLIGYPLRIVEVTIQDFTWRFSTIFFSINSLLLFIELLRKALGIYRKLSITMHLFISSIKKNIHLVIMAFIFMIGFGVAQYILKCSQTTCMIHKDRGIWDYFLWIFLDTFKIMFGAYEVTEFLVEATPFITTVNLTTLDASYSAEWMYLSSSFTLLTLLIVWQFISHIIIINLLIANFIKIYEDISKKADLLWKQELLRTYFSYKDWSFIPFFYRPLFTDYVREEIVEKENDGPIAGRYWRQRDEEDKQQSDQDGIESIILPLIASNYYTRRQIHRIENYLQKIHNEKFPDTERDNDVADSFEGVFEI